MKMPSRRPLVSLAFPHPWEAGKRPAGSPNHIELEPGMLMEIHPNVFVPGVFKGPERWPLPFAPPAPASATWWR